MEGFLVAATRRSVAMLVTAVVIVAIFTVLLAVLSRRRGWVQDSWQRELGPPVIVAAALLVGNLLFNRDLVIMVMQTIAVGTVGVAVLWSRARRQRRRASGGGRPSAPRPSG